MENFENETKTKKSGGLLVIFLFVIIAIVAGAGYYFLKTNNPQYVFEKAIGEVFSSDRIEKNDFKTAKVTTNISAKINSKDDNVKEVSNLINDAKLTVLSEMNVEKKEEIIGIKLVKSSDDLLDAKMKLEEESQNIYIDLGELFDKTLQLNVKDVLDDEINIEDKSVSTMGEMINSLKAQQIAKDEVKKQLKKDYFSSEKVNIDGNNYTKNEFKINSIELVEVMKTIFKDLSNNEDFLACYEDKDEVKNWAIEVIESLDDVKTNKDVYIIIDIYTSGFMKDVEKVYVSVDDGKEKYTIQLSKKSDSELIYKVLSDEKIQLEGEAKGKLEKNNFELEISMKYEESELLLNVNGNVVYDETLDNVKTEDAVNINDLSTEDFYKIMENLSESKLYKVIEDISGSYDSTSDLNYDLNDIEDKEDEEKEDDDNKKNKKNNATADNIVKTYDGDEIKFSIPDDFKIYSSDSDTYKLFEKDSTEGNINIDVTVSYSSMDEYKKSLESKAKRYEEDESYSNVELSDPEEIEVNGKKFTKQTLKYDYNGYSTINYYNEYYSYEINSEYIYTVEIEGADLVSDEELNAFLTIEE